MNIGLGVRTREILDSSVHSNDDKRLGSIMHRSLPLAVLFCTHAMACLAAPDHLIKKAG